MTINKLYHTINDTIDVNKECDDNDDNNTIPQSNKNASFANAIHINNDEYVIKWKKKRTIK